MNDKVFHKLIEEIKRSNPYSAAFVRGSAKYPDLAGIVAFSPLGRQTLVKAHFCGLPFDKNDVCSQRFFAMHIHSGSSCSGTPDMPFANAQGHYNPSNCAHPNHSGDLPPLLSANGFAWCSFLTSGFSAQEVVGKTMIVHRNRDDFSTQPSGDPGEMIACGEILRLRQEPWHG